MSAAVKQTPKKPSSSRKKDAIQSLISKPPIIVKSTISQLRYLILVDGLGVPNGSDDGQSSYRCYAWSILLRVKPTNSSYYVNLIRRGPSAAYTKIRNDTFRTLATDVHYRSKVSEEALIRVLNAFAWRQQLDQSSARDKRNS